MTTFEILNDLCTTYLRPILYWQATDGTTNLRGAAGLTPQFDPPLTVEEQAVYARLQRAARSAVQGITPDEWLAIENDLAALRTFRQQTQALLRD